MGRFSLYFRLSPKQQNQNVGVGEGGNGGNKEEKVGGRDGGKWGGMKKNRGEKGRNGEKKEKKGEKEEKRGEKRKEIGAEKKKNALKMGGRN